MVRLHDGMMFVYGGGGGGNVSDNERTGVYITRNRERHGKRQREKVEMKSIVTAEYRVNSKK